MRLLDVSHYKQRRLADCLPICVQMVADYLGLKLRYEHLVRLLGTRDSGTAFRNLQRLDQLGVDVTVDYFDLDTVSSYLEKGIPVLAGVHTAELGYWSQSVNHVVVVVGLDPNFVYVNDPSLEKSPKVVPIVEFELAQMGFDYLCGVIQKHP